jgi:hypothetical protein
MNVRLQSETKFSKGNPRIVTSVHRGRKTHRARNMRDTLTSSNSKTVHTSIFSIIIYKSYAVATIRHLGCILPKNYVFIVAFTLNLQRAFVYSITVFLYHHGTIIKLLPLAILVKGICPNLEPPYNARISLLALYLL